MKKLRVGVLFGGRSTEHEVSVISARNVVAALDPARYEVVPIAIDRTGRFHPLPAGALSGATAPALELEGDAPVLSLALRGPGSALAPSELEGPAAIDVVFPVLHGPLGEDGTIQGMLELLDLPFVGCGVLGSAVGMDKDVAKRLLRDAGIAVVPFVTLRESEFARDRQAACARASHLGLPLFTKPANAGSSVGVRRVTRSEDLAPALAHAFEFDTKALIESAIEGAREIECAVLGNDEPEVSVPGEIVVQHRDGFYSYEAKYLDEKGAQLEIPARLDPEQTRVVRELAQRTFVTLECQGMARVDFFLSSRGEFFVNEVNTIPGFTAMSMYPKLWEHSGLAPRELMTKLIELALEHKRRERKLRRDVSQS